jgi:uncharacterized membrane-anchored protein YjiN (DUF445 family)
VSMHSLFNKLSKEKDHIRDVVFPAIDRLENESYQKNDIEGMKSAIRQRKEVNKRLADIVKLMEHIVEGWETEKGADK